MASRSMRPKVSGKREAVSGKVFPAFRSPLPAYLSGMSDLLQALAGVPNASLPFHGLATAGQPSAAALTALRDAGGAVVLDIRDSMAPLPFDWPALARTLGLDHLNPS